MSSLIQPRRIKTGTRKRTFIIVASRFNNEYVQGLVDHASVELRALMPEVEILLQSVPGAFEIPVVVREFAVHDRPHAIIACGVILKGETNHAENLIRSVTDALQRIAVSHGVPVVNAVLMFDNVAQAQERCLGDRINRGTEAGRAAADMVKTFFELRKS
jgi:6,7-dimethyl-8-ribityllumazine synthase